MRVVHHYKLNFTICTILDGFWKDILLDILMFMDEVRARRDGASGESQDDPAASPSGEGSKSSMELERSCAGIKDNQPEKVEASTNPLLGLEEACKKVSLGSEISENQTAGKAESVHHSMAAWQMEGRQLMEGAEAARSRARRIRVSFV